MKAFFISLAVATLLLAGGTLWLAESVLIPEAPSFMWATLILLLLLTSLIYIYLYRSGGDSFMQFYFLTLVLKLIFYAGYNTVIILLDRNSAVPNVVFFLISYFLYTALEIGFLYRKIAR